MARSSMRYVVSARAVSCLAAVCCAVLVPGCAAPEPAGRAASGQPSVTASATSTSSTATASGDDEPVIEVRISDGRVTPPPGRVEVSTGDQVIFTIATDVPDEVHVHGYEVERQLPAGETTTVKFTADTPGLFEVETHDSGTQLFQLLVR